MAGKRLLLVDDEEQLVEMVKMRLEASGYETWGRYFRQCVQEEMSGIIGIFPSK